MVNLTEHYRLLLGLGDAWTVSNVALFLEEKRVDIRVTHGAGPVVCPEWDETCTIADHSPELQTMRRQDDRRSLGEQAFPIRAHVRGPGHRRLNCLRQHQGGGRTARITWDAAQRIMNRAVERALAQRVMEKVEHVDMDKKSFRRRITNAASEGFNIIRVGAEH